MICKCGRPATHKVAIPLSKRRPGRGLVARYYWCKTCVDAERAKGVYLVAVEIGGVVQEH